MRNSTDRILLSVLAVLVGCYIAYLYTRSDVSSPAPSVFNVPDTATPVVTSVLPNDSVYPEIFSAAFAPGTNVQQGNQRFTFTTLQLGDLIVGSGRIIACDEVMQSGAVPFTGQFPIGQFPVELALANSNNYESVAFARILFSSDTIVRWEFALQPGQDSIGLTDSISYCYPVDAATGLFVDSVSNVRFNEGGETQWNDAFLSERMMNNSTGFMYTFTRYNMAIFSTGYGDGCYSTYIGYNNKNQPCCLLTDFGLIRWWQQKPSFQH